MRLLVCALALVALAAGVQAQCGAKIGTAMGCAAAGFMEKLAGMPAMEIDEEKLEADIKACFPASGCKDLDEFEAEMKKLHGSHSHGSSMMSSGSHGSGSGSHGDMEGRMSMIADLLGIDPEEMKVVFEVGMECSDSLEEDAIPWVEKCIADDSESLSDFKFPPKPPMPAKLVKHMELKGKGKGEMMDQLSMAPIPIQILEILKGVWKGGKEMMHEAHELAMVMASPMVCPTEAEMTKVRTCVDEKIDAHMPEELKCVKPLHMFYKMIDLKNDMCAKRAECTTDLGDECIAAAKSLPKSMCTCGEDYLDEKWTEITGKVTTCMSEKMTEMGKEPPQISQMMVQGPLKAIVKKMLKKECAKMHTIMEHEEFDPCSPSFDPEALKHAMKHEHGHGKGHGKGMMMKGMMKGMAKGGM